MTSTPGQSLRPAPQENQSQFTVFIRLPFPRGDFVDPPPVEWNSSKDRELWDILSRASKGREMDWQALAERFDVTLSFLLQQAAWLYEQQLSQVKAQLRKATRPTSIGSSPTPGSTSGSAIAGGHAMTRGGSGGSRVPSSLSNRQKDRPVSQCEGSKTELPTRAHEPQLSRNSSTNTVFQAPSHSPTIPQQGFVERQSSLRLHLRNREGPRKSLESQTRRPQFSDRPTSRSDKNDESSNSSSSSESDNTAPLSRSRAYMRRPRYSNSKPPLGPLSDADEDQEDSQPFLPFSDARMLAHPKPSDPSATVRIAPEKPSSVLQSPIKPEAPGLSHTAHSSSSSAQSQSQPSSRNARIARNPLSSLSPRQRRIAKEGSEGTQSMGSSFSDLDDASVTQSALEEALANEMNHGGVASRMSTISQALRSRYL